MLIALPVSPRLFKGWIALSILCATKARSNFTSSLAFSYVKALLSRRNLFTQRNGNRASTGSEAFCFLIYLDAAKFVKPSCLALIETTWPKVQATLWGILQNVYLRLRCAAQKRLRLNSLLYENSSQQNSVLKCK